MRWIVAAIFAAALVGFAWYLRMPAKVPLPPIDQAELAGGVVTAFGNELKQVPLSGSDEVVRAAIQERYAAHVTPELLAVWLAEPSAAPGRLTSSPWPERIEVTNVMPDDTGWIVEGKVIEVTSQEVTTEGSASTYPIRAKVSAVEGNTLRITAFERVPEE